MVARHFTPARPLAVVALTPEGAPRLLRWRGRDERVAASEATWETRHAWWDEGAVQRRYYRLRTVRGTLLVVYRDLPSGAWFLDAVLD